MTGEELLAKIIAMLGTHPSLKWFHSYDPRRDKQRGYPDLTIAGPRGVLWAEVKGAAEELSSSQVDWKWILLASGQAWRIWRTCDWPDEIERQIKGIL